MTTRTFDSVSVGDELPSLAIPITVTLITGGAIATRDYFPGHHDADSARAQGQPHIFMNILTTSGLVERFVEGWAGPESRLGSLKIKLGAPNYPGDTMTFTGEVTDKREDDRSIEVTLVGKNKLGPHASGTARVKLP